MNPQSQPPKPGPEPVREPNPPALVNAQIVQGIPVKNPAGTMPQPVITPTVKLTKPVADITPVQPQPVVKNAAKQAENSPNAQGEPTKANRGSPPIIATIVACLIALLLSAAAVYVYREGL